MSDHEAQELAKAASQQVLTFVLGNETYGVDILRVQEIRGWSAVTKIPHAPAHVLGVLNLRGSIVPVVDLRMRFNLVDVVSSAVKPAPELGARAATEHIRGLVSVAEHMVVLLDIDKLIGVDMDSATVADTEGQPASAAAA